MKETFLVKRFKSKWEALLKPIEEIFERFSAQGFQITVRQLHYQLVKANLYANTHENYRMLVGLVTDGRLTGRLDWDVVEDRTRRARQARSWTSLDNFLSTIKYQFALDKWKNQDNYVEVMCEKDALSGVLTPTCQRVDVAYTANKGYSSTSASYEAGKRLRAMAEMGKKCHIIYLGDHDPSGQDMTRDVLERIEMFAGISYEEGGPAPGQLTVIRKALTMAQVKQYQCLPQPVKKEDPRAKAYNAKYGHESWELDALEPSDLAAMVEEEVIKLRDQAGWDKAVDEERESKKMLDRFVKNARKRLSKKFGDNP